MNASFTCGDRQLARLWLCFGTPQYQIDEATIAGLLERAQTNVLPINTHRLTAGAGREALELGYGGVTWDAYAAGHDLQSYTPVLNINHACSAEEAIERTHRAVALTDERFIKLEVLDPGLTTSDQAAIVAAARALIAWNRDLVVLPLLGCELETARRLVDAGCPMLRVMGSPISSGRGIADVVTLREICGLGVPVLVDGGIGEPDHVRQALAAGAAGVLVNSTLYRTGQDPLAAIARFADVARREFAAPLLVRRDGATTSLPTTES